MITYLCQEKSPSRLEYSIFKFLIMFKFLSRQLSSKWESHIKNRPIDGKFPLQALHFVSVLCKFPCPVFQRERNIFIFSEQFVYQNVEQLGIFFNFQILIYWSYRFTTIKRLEKILSQSLSHLESFT